MPCQYYGPGEEEAILRKAADNLSAMLCAVCRAYPQAVDAHPDLAEWWEEHQRHDREREEREARERQRKEEAELTELQRLRNKYGRVEIERHRKARLEQARTEAEQWFWQRRHNEDSGN